MMNGDAELNYQVPSVKNSKRSDTFVLVFLDAILDTRMGVIGQSNPELASKILSSGKYFNRNFDEFDGLSNTEFKALYDKRDVETLPHSVVTNVSFFLQRLVKDAMFADSLAPNDDKLIVHLNLWPYTDLTQEEIDSFRDAVRFYTYSYAEVVVINKPLIELTPKFCKENYDIIIMYDYEKLLETHVEAFEKVQMPGVSLVAPAMYRTELPQGEDAEAIRKLKMNPFSAIEIGLAAVVGLKLMPVSLFCITDQINPENKKHVLEAIRYTEEYLMEVINKTNSKAEKFDMDKTIDIKPISEDEML